VAEVAEVALSHSVSGPPSTDTYTLYDVMPEPAPSLPLQWTFRFPGEELAGRGVTVAVGVVLSMLFDHTGVAIGVFRSKTIVAWACTFVPVASPGFAWAV
jgi:hypothetical protein